MHNMAQKSLAVFVRNFHNSLENFAKRLPQRQLIPRVPFIENVANYSTHETMMR